MAIRLRIVQGEWVALCAYETDEKMGDVYIDDGQHYALVCKFGIDQKLPYVDEIKRKLMDCQKIRDCMNRKDF